MQTQRILVSAGHSTMLPLRTALCCLSLVLSGHSAPFYGRSQGGSTAIETFEDPVLEELDAENYKEYNKELIETLKRMLSYFSTHFSENNQSDSMQCQILDHEKEGVFQFHNLTGKIFPYQRPVYKALSLSSIGFRKYYEIAPWTSNCGVDSCGLTVPSTVVSDQRSFRNQGVKKNVEPYPKGDDIQEKKFTVDTTTNIITSSIYPNEIYLNTLETEPHPNTTPNQENAGRKFTEFHQYVSNESEPNNVVSSSDKYLTNTSDEEVMNIKETATRSYSDKTSENNLETDLAGSESIQNIERYKQKTSSVSTTLGYEIINRTEKRQDLLDTFVTGLSKFTSATSSYDSETNGLDNNQIDVSQTHSDMTYSPTIPTSSVAEVSYFSSHYSEHTIKVNDDKSSIGPDDSSSSTINVSTDSKQEPPIESLNKGNHQTATPEFTKYKPDSSYPQHSFFEVVTLNSFDHEGLVKSENASSQHYFTSLGELETNTISATQNTDKTVRSASYFTDTTVPLSTEFSTVPKESTDFSTVTTYSNRTEKSLEISTTPLSIVIKTTNVTQHNFTEFEEQTITDNAIDILHHQQTTFVSDATDPTNGLSEDVRSSTINVTSGLGTTSPYTLFNNLANKTYTIQSVYDSAFENKDFTTNYGQLLTNRREQITERPYLSITGYITESSKALAESSNKTTTYKENGKLINISNNVVTTFIPNITTAILNYETPKFSRNETELHDYYSSFSTETTDPVTRNNHDSPINRSTFEPTTNNLQAKITDVTSEPSDHQKSTNNRYQMETRTVANYYSYSASTTATNEDNTLKYSSDVTSTSSSSDDDYYHLDPSTVEYSPIIHDNIKSTTWSYPNPEAYLTSKLYSTSNQLDSTDSLSNSSDKTNPNKEVSDAYSTSIGIVTEALQDVEHENYFHSSPNLMTTRISSNRSPPSIPVKSTSPSLTSVFDSRPTNQHLVKKNVTTPFILNTYGTSSETDIFNSNTGNKSENTAQILSTTPSFTTLTDSSDTMEYNENTKYNLSELTASTPTSQLKTSHVIEIDNMVYNHNSETYDSSEGQTIELPTPKDVEKQITETNRGYIKSSTLSVNSTLISTISVTDTLFHSSNFNEKQFNDSTPKFSDRTLASGATSNNLEANVISTLPALDSSTKTASPTNISETEQNYTTGGMNIIDQTEENFIPVSTTSPTKSMNETTDVIISTSDLSILGEDTSSIPATHTMSTIENTNTAQSKILPETESSSIKQITKNNNNEMTTSSMFELSKSTLDSNTRNHSTSETTTISNQITTKAINPERPAEEIYNDEGISNDQSYAVTTSTLNNFTFSLPTTEFKTSYLPVRIHPLIIFSEIK